MFFSKILESDDLVPLDITGSTTESAMAMLNQAERLKNEIKDMENAIKQTKKEKMEKEASNVDRWMERLLVNVTIDENTEMLNTVDQVMTVLQDGRYSPEQVHKIFQRLTDNIPNERLEQSMVKVPRLELLMLACCKLDMLEREDNPNKRWNGRVERDLRKWLFALEWNIDISDRYLDKPDR